MYHVWCVYVCGRDTRQARGDKGQGKEDKGGKGKQEGKKGKSEDKGGSKGKDHKGGKGKDGGKGGKDQGGKGKAKQDDDKGGKGKSKQEDAKGGKGKDPRAPSHDELVFGSKKPRLSSPERAPLGAPGAPIGAPIASRTLMCVCMHVEQMKFKVYVCCSFACYFECEHDRVHSMPAIFMQSLQEPAGAAAPADADDAEAAAGAADGAAAGRAAAGCTGIFFFSTLCMTRCVLLACMQTCTVHECLFVA